MEEAFGFAVDVRGENDTARESCYGEGSAARNVVRFFTSFRMTSRGTLSSRYKVFHQSIDSLPPARYYLIVNSLDGLRDWRYVEFTTMERGPV